jgi:hypothetical protein
LLLGHWLSNEHGDQAWAQAAYSLPTAFLALILVVNCHLTFKVTVLFIWVIVKPSVYKSFLNLLKEFELPVK